MKNSKDLLSSILKTAQMGQVGIRSILKTDLNDDLRISLKDQLSEYDKIEQEVYVLAEERGWTPEKLNPIVKGMSDMISRSRLSIGHPSSKAAAMMIKGNTRGMIKSLKNLHRYNHSDPQIESLARKLLLCEENNIVKMQGYV